MKSKTFIEEMGFLYDQEEARKRIAEIPEGKKQCVAILKDGETTYECHRAGVMFSGCCVHHHD